MAAPTVITRQARLVLSPEDGSSNPGAEYNPAVAGLANGGFVAVWDDFLPAATDPDGSVSTMLRAFGRLGLPLGNAARPVSGDLRGNFGGLEAVVSLPGGLVAVAWDAGDTDFSRIGARIIKADTGAGVGAELTIEAPGRGSGRDILLHGLVALPGGRAGVLYINRNDPLQNGLRLALLERDGRSGGDQLLLRQSAQPPFSPFVASLGAGDTVAGLQGVNAGVIAVVLREPLSNAISVRFFSSSGGSAPPELIIGDTDGFNPILAPLSDGGAVLVWGGIAATGAALYRLQRISAEGSRIGVPTELTLPGEFFGAADVIGLPDGGILLAATVVASSGGFRSEIVLQRLRADGRPDGGPLTIADPNISYARPQLALSGDGTVVMVYEAGGNQIEASRLSLGGTDPTGPGGADGPILGDAGANRLQGTPQDDSLDGRGGNDRLSGLAGDDLLIGGAGQDRLEGGAGDDTLIGGAGDDLLSGGAGRDVVLFTAQDQGGRDQLLGWDKGDRLAFQGLGAVQFLGADPFPGGSDLAAVRTVVGRNSTTVLFDSGDADARADFSIQFDRAPTLRAADVLSL